MKSQTNLNPLLIDQIPNFAHLVTTRNQSKTDFLNKVKTTYSETNPKTNLFCIAVERSTFETIRLSEDRQSILFNQ